MALKLTWSARRQLLYYAVGLVVCTALVWVLYTLFLTTTPSCFDGSQNQDERGVDCGGVCTLVCQADVRAVSVLWARAFEVAPGYYSAAAYVRNDNLSAGAKNIRYSFQLFDKDNLLVVEREGAIDLPPVPTIPIVESNIQIGNRTVARTLFSLISTPVWKTTSIAPLRVTNQQLSQDASRLSAQVVNDTLNDVRRVLVTGVLFDAAGVARAASQSRIDVPRKGLAEVIFTWPIPTANIVRADITVLPSF